MTLTGSPAGGNGFGAEPAVAYSPPRRDLNTMYPVFGPQAKRIAAALGSLDLPVEVLTDPDALLFELARETASG